MERQELTIGRAPDNDLVIDDADVSPHHARIVRIRASFFLEDLGSTHGTFVNNERTDEQEIKDQDAIRIADHHFVFDLQRDAGDPTEPLDERIPAESLLHETQEAVVLVMSGKTDRPQYTLTDSVVLVGSDADATVKLKGWFAPRRAALFRRDRGVYVLYPGPDGKHIFRNNVSLTGPTPLHDGDLLEIGGVHLCFYLKTPSAT